MAIPDYVCMMRPKPEYYRELAKHSRKLAGRISNAEAKAHLLDVARQYDKLAQATARKD